MPNDAVQVPPSLGPSTQDVNAAAAVTGSSARGSGTTTSREKMNIVIVGHVDHGKSTLVGRLLADTGGFPVGKVEKVQKTCEQQGKKFEYAFLLDALEAEQAQGITIDAARIFFQTERRDYIILDAPGHIEFLKNMVTGASRAEAAILLIDANEGVRENSRRHGYLMSMLGVRNVVVAVNKMDLVGYDPAVFTRIRDEYVAFLATCGLTPQHFVPVAARDGVNLFRRGGAVMPWYGGPTILESIDGFTKTPPAADLPLRLPVQDVYKFNARGDDRRIVAGRVEAGRLAVGDELVFLPSGKRTRVATIERFPRTEPLPSAVLAGQSTGFTLTEQIWVERGEIACRPAEEAPPRVSSRLKVSLFWLGKQPMLPGRTYGLKIATKAVPCRIEEIERVIDASEVGGERAPTHVGRNDVAELVLSTRTPVAFDAVADCASTGRFVIVDGYEICGGGIVREALSDEEDRRREADERTSRWRHGNVSRAMREQRTGHKACLVLFTGDRGTGKAVLAQALEEALFDDGLDTYLLDAPDLTEELGDDRRGAVRRFANLARLVLDTGQVVVSTTNTVDLAEHAAIRELLAPTPVLFVHVSRGEAQLPEAMDLLVHVGEPAPEILGKIRGQLEPLLARVAKGPEAEEPLSPPAKRD